YHSQYRFPVYSVHKRSVYSDPFSSLLSVIYKYFIFKLFIKKRQGCLSNIPFFFLQKFTDIMVHFLGNYSQGLFFLFCYSFKDDILDLPVNFFKFYDNDLGILCQIIMSASSVLKILLHSYISFFLEAAKGLGN